MKRIAVATMLATLVACGVDGKPTPPAAKTGLVISGDARMGVVARP